MNQDELQVSPASKRANPSKSSKVERLLRRKGGATLTEIGKATDWQPHSCRAFLSGLRKKGTTVLKENRLDGDACYRVEA